MKRETKTSLKSMIAVALLMGISALAQLADHPSNNIQGTAPGGQIAGDVIGSFIPQLGGTLPVGLEAYGGGLWGTDITNDVVGFMDLSGNLQNSFIGIGTPIGVSTDGSNVYLTDTATTEIHIHDTSGNLLSSFDVSGVTTFPEGVTYNGDNGNLFVVDGSGGDQVGEYTTGGTLVNTYPINGSSQDGIAYDGAGFYYVYDSGTDTISRYDGSFNLVEAFDGTGAAGFANGEGLAYAENVVYVVSPGSNLVVAFDAGRIEVPTLSEMGLISMIGLMLLASVAVMRRRSATA